MEVEIISKDYVKPSSSTLHHLKTYKLSLLDQFMSTSYVPVLLLYPTSQSSNLSSLLRHALSETLTLFYPFAGRIKDSLSIDCNDEGACYVEARVGHGVSEFLNHPDCLKLSVKLFPGEFNECDLAPGSHCLMVQETRFRCGGISIGAYFTHAIADARTVGSFLEIWAKMARKSGGEISFPDFQTPSLFPQNSALPFESTFSGLVSPFTRKGKGRVRRLVFDGAALDRLKFEASSSGVTNPTRVEVVCSFVTKCLMTIFKAKTGVDKPMVVNHSVNIRTRAAPTFPEASFGNFVLPVTALCRPENGEISSLVLTMREEISKVNGELVRNLQGEDGMKKLCEYTNEMAGKVADMGSPNDVNYLVVSSWCKFGFYEVDFGFGKPVSFMYAGSTEEEEWQMNVLGLMDRREDKGIEAWLFLDSEIMDLLFNDEELLSYAVPLNP